MLRGRCTTAVALGALSLIAASAARAQSDKDPVDACLRAADDGQRLRDQGKYLRARAAFLECSKDACPGAVRTECLSWLRDAEQAIPTVVIAARDSAGNDLTDASVYVDGDRVLDRLDGKPLAVDPGRHELRVELGARSLRREILLVAAEKNRVLTFELPPAPARARPTAREPSVVEPTGTTPWLGFALAGVGALGVGSFAYFGLTAKSDLDALESDPCAETRTCAESDVDSVRARYLIADVSLGVGLVALGAATWIFATHDGSPATRVGARLGRSGASLSVSTGF